MLNLCTEWVLEVDALKRSIDISIIIIVITIMIIITILIVISIILSPPEQFRLN